MSKFKVGDKVVLKDIYNQKLTRYTYTVYTVASHLIRVSHEGEDLTWWPADKFELLNKHHKHHDAIIAWAKGEEIEVKGSLSGGWFNAVHPMFTDHMEYRIKPTEPEFEEGHYIVTRYGNNRVLRLRDAAGRDRAIADGCKIIKRINESEWNV